MQNPPTGTAIRSGNHGDRWRDRDGYLKEQIQKELTEQFQKQFKAMKETAKDTKHAMPLTFRLFWDPIFRVLIKTQGSSVCKLKKLSHMLPKVRKFHQLMYLELQ